MGSVREEHSVEVIEHIGTCILIMYVYIDNVRVGSILEECVEESGEDLHMDALSILLRYVYTLDINVSNFTVYVYVCVRVCPDVCSHQAGQRTHLHINYVRRF